MKELVRTTICLCQDWPGGAVLKLPPAIEEKPASAFQPYNWNNSYPQLLSKIKNCFETDFHLSAEVSLELLPGITSALDNSYLVVSLLMLFLNP